MEYAAKVHHVGPDTLKIENGGTLDAGGLVTFANVTPGEETTGSAFTTGTTWVAHTAVGSCFGKVLASYSGASGDYATFRLRARSDAAGAAGGDGQLNGVVCVNASASASVNNQANLYAVQGYAQPNTYTHNSAAHIVCGVYSCIDASGASSGRRWSLWTDDHSITKAAGGHFLHRLSLNPIGGAGVAIDGVWSIYGGGKLPVLINFEDLSGCLTDANASLVTQSGAIAVKTPTGTKYIPLYNLPA